MIKVFETYNDLIIKMKPNEYDFFLNFFFQIQDFLFFNWGYIYKLSFDIQKSEELMQVA